MRRRHDAAARKFEENGGAAPLTARQAGDILPKFHYGTPAERADISDNAGEETASWKLKVSLSFSSSA
jgi:hypothetical protein